MKRMQMRSYDEKRAFETLDLPAATTKKKKKKKIQIRKTSVTENFLNNKESK